MKKIPNLTNILLFFIFTVLVLGLLRPEIKNFKVWYRLNKLQFTNVSDTEKYTCKGGEPWKINSKDKSQTGYYDTSPLGIKDSPLNWEIVTEQIDKNGGKWTTPTGICERVTVKKCFQVFKKCLFYIK